MIRRLRRALGGLSIGRKLVAMMVGLTAFGFLLASTGLVIEHRRTIRSSLSNNLSILTQVVGDNCKAALVFGDPDAAAQTLRALRANQHIVEAILTDADGNRFARYSRGDAEAPDVDAVHVTTDILLDGRPVGQLLVSSDLEEWQAGMRHFAQVALVVFCSISLLTLGLAIRVQRLFTAPIADLIRTTLRVTETEDYTLRATKTSEDEMGTLVDGFNIMLAEIEYRDGELRGARDALRRHLAELERQRGELATSNLALKREVGEREQAELATARFARELQQSNSELEQFAYVASHDLQEPLRGIAGSLQLLKRRYENKLDADADQLIEFAVDGARRLRTLISDLLAYSRVNTKQQPPEPVDCEEVRKRVLADLAVAIVEARAEVTHDPLPTVLGDRVQLPLLFQNLVSNALKFHGEDPPRIHLGATRRDDGWEFSVSDNGIGIEPRFSKRIFEIFQRLHNRVDYQGTGIGLAIAKKIVDRHHGSIWIESEVGAGTTFYFTLPDTEGTTHA